MENRAMSQMQTNLHRINPDQNMHRFYQLRVEPTLFEDWCLIRQWGRIGSNGQAKRQWFAHISDATMTMQKLEGAKKRKGYVVK